MNDSDTKPNDVAHISVLLNEVMEGLEIKPDDVVVDATINGGGHSSVIIKSLGDKGTLMGIDMDQEALNTAEKRLFEAKCRVILKEGNFRNVDQFLKEENIPSMDKILFDLGMSTRQLDSSKRGFSFKRDEPLLMTFKQSPTEDDITAGTILNEWDEENIADIIFGYGEEKFSRRIAHEIVEARKEKPIETTQELVELIKKATPLWYHTKGKHIGTRTFQALRIAVNDEIRGTSEALKKSIDLLSEGGRIAVITFHSIEDRLVKRQFRSWKEDGKGLVITKKPIPPTLEEVKENPRARSAKLRIFEKQTQI